MINLTKNIVVYKERFPSTVKIHHASVLPEDAKSSRYSTGSYDRLDFENRPLPGFTLQRIEGNDPQFYRGYWKVIDPRGFIVKISSRNLNNIIHYSGITEGLIQEECVWAREDENSAMELISINDPRYLEAIKNTEMIENKVDLSDVQVGDKVFIQSGHTGTYMGTMSLHTVTEKERERVYPRVFKDKQVIKIDSANNQVTDYLYKSDLKILKIIERAKSPYTLADSIAEINNGIKNDTARIHYDDRLQTGRFYTKRGISYVTKSKKLPKFAEIEVDYNYATQIFMKFCNSDLSVPLAVEDHKGKKHYVTRGSPYGVVTVPAEVNADEITMLGQYSEDTEKLDSYAKFYIIKKIINDQESYI